MFETVGDIWDYALGDSCCRIRPSAAIAEIIIRLGLAGHFSVVCGDEGKGWIE